MDSAEAQDIVGRYRLNAREISEALAFAVVQSRGAQGRADLTCNVQISVVMKGIAVSLDPESLHAIVEVAVAEGVARA